MNLISTPQKEETSDIDAKFLYDLVSQCLGRKLDPCVDKLALSKPDWNSRSAQLHTILCQINQDGYVMLKRCADNPCYIRREYVIAKIKEKIKWLPNYNGIKQSGIKLRVNSADNNCELLLGWENKEFVVIDIGNYKLTKRIFELELADIEDLGRFCFEYGRWAAFNYLFVIRDRNNANFVFFTNTHILHSIDNEDGPFDSNGNNAGTADIVTSTRQHIERLIVGQNRPQYIQKLIEGFIDGWKMISEHIECIDNLEPNEFDLLKKMLKDPASEIAEAIFV
ncbi:hypothetical protein QVH35_03800 [Candidatus Nitrosotenuis chungbukensis]|uniref:hypothetical protein n=1 Tax=Candidatus Nitrosotenuis chungbukensis TaxID=1353246 RepID=UPI0005B26BA0|nr:hypothetical protein [Candidatus Nitrosotenuis chungbukensis]WKT58518.1 hypothetical protein QVH35_03800 [Candidatus Nitrosotenuis chungbukensis]